MNMTAIKHHLDEATLMGYATGNLPEAFNLLVAAHVSLCDACRAAVESYDAVGGSLLEGATAAMSENSLATTLARLKSEPVIAKQPKNDGALPTPLQHYVGGDLASIKWRPVGMGVKQAVLATSGTATARLLFIPAGTAMPHHGHRGTELTMVLQGAFQDDEAYFARGDVEIADASVNHIPVADIHDDCICLAVTDAPLRFKGWLPRIVQKFVGI